jgi:hypothetical protein
LLFPRDRLDHALVQFIPDQYLATRRRVASSTLFRLTAHVTPSLRAQRSNPFFLLLRAMDCFAEPVIGRRFAPTRWLAMTGEGHPAPISGSASSRSNR